ncbi:Endodeoxyribonuclease RusA [Marinobacter sp. THAF39]|nr:Endodeoxyribonuclease RusA [Marinobacter sp. THAF197a]QFT51390.1 Endodeoxyribonuclease RusA [Marinobacter sp. THAF39]
MTTFVETGLKPLSANESYLGKKTKSKAYRMYESHMLRVLPDLPLEPKGKLKLTAEVYYSNKLSDLDNALKPFIDCLQKRYLFNDNRIYKLEVEKFIVEKGAETIRFRLDPYTQEGDKDHVPHQRDDGEHRCPECGFSL